MYRCTLMALSSINWESYSLCRVRIDNILKGDPTSQ